ncbi:MAG: hypothetical protein V4459_07045 [Pseudomonadota bacterium]
MTEILLDSADDVPTLETLAAAQLLGQQCPSLSVRVVMPEVAEWRWCP